MQKFDIILASMEDRLDFSTRQVNHSDWLNNNRFSSAKTPHKNAVAKRVRDDILGKDEVQNGPNLRRAQRPPFVQPPRHQQVRHIVPHCWQGLHGYVWFQCKVVVTIICLLLLPFPFQDLLIWIGPTNCSTKLLEMSNMNWESSNSHSRLKLYARLLLEIR